MMSPMDPHSFPPQLLWLPCIHTLYPSIIMDPMAPHSVPLNDYVYHVSTLCNPQWWWLSIIMDPMAPSNLSPFNDYGSLMMNIRWWVSCLCTNGWLTWLEDDCQKYMRRFSIVQCITTLAPSSAHPSDMWFSFPLFDDILTPPPFNIQSEHSLLDVFQFTYISTHMDKGLL